MTTQRLIFGTGKVSTIIKNPGDVIVSHAECDITDYKRLQEIFNAVNPTVVINTAAKTNLEYCEDNKLISYETNTGGPINLLELCAEHKSKLVHISSGCLFDGNDNIATEKSDPNTSVWYTHIKRWADEYIQSFGYENYLILRPRQMISAVPHPTNMLSKFSKYKEIYAHMELNSITCVEDFKDMLEHLVKQEQIGIFNCCNNGVITPYEIALGVKRYIKPELTVIKSTYEHTLTLQPNRRVNTILSNDKLKATGYHPRSAQEALEWALKNYG